MNTEQTIFTYPEERTVYREVDAERADVYLPEYVAKVVRDQAEMLGAELYIDVWWPYVYITFIRSTEKEVEHCVEENWKDGKAEAEGQCREKCEGDEKCIEECIDEVRATMWNTCREGIADELRPSFAKALYELEYVFRLYGIVAEPEIRYDHEGLKLRIKLKGYNEIAPIDLTKVLLTYVIDAAKTKYFADLEKLTYKTAVFLFRTLTVERVVKLIHSITKENIKITRTLDEHIDLRRYEIVLEHEDVKITFHITEERERHIWIIRDITINAVEFTEVADLASA
jgi:hypothetical protein